MEAKVKPQVIYSQVIIKPEKALRIWGGGVVFFCLRLHWWFSSKESTCNTEDSGSIPGWERSPGGGNGNSFQYSCLENPMDWWATVHRVAESDMTEQTHFCLL